MCLRVPVGSSAIGVRRNCSKRGWSELIAHLPFRSSQSEARLPAVSSQQRQLSRLGKLSLWHTARRQG